MRGSHGPYIVHYAKRLLPPPRETSMHVLALSSA
jgi:hypothetical protein